MRSFVGLRMTRQRSHGKVTGPAAAPNEMTWQSPQRLCSERSHSELEANRNDPQSSSDEEDCYESMSSSDGGSVSGSSVDASLTTALEQQPITPPRKEKRRSFIRTASPPSRKSRKWNLPPIAMKRPVPQTPLDVELYMTKREMTPTQERWNAITMIPSAVYCLYFLVTAQWLSPKSVDEVTTGSWNHWNATSAQDWTLMQAINEWMGSDDADGCLDGSRWWHFDMPALPPLPVLAIALGICLHAPFSFLYHWKFAHRLPPKARSQHWSRRMDQSMIHVCSTCLSYAVTGSWSYLVLNVLYNADCCRRQFRPVVRPKLNQIRIFISMLAYTLPLLARGEWHTFLHMWMVLGFSGWFFVQYPVGGWSHAVFHVLLIAIPPLLFQTATLVAVAEPQLHHAATCAALYHHEINRALISSL